jgi:hypothetical protein
MTSTHYLDVHERPWSMPNRELLAKTRIYGAMELVPDELAEQEQWTWPHVATVTAAFKEAEPEEAKRIMAGYRRATRQLTAAAKQALLPLLTEAGIKATEADLHFSTKAGCGCGCSPGFILNRREYGPNHQPIDFYVKARQPALFAV